MENTFELPIIFNGEELSFKAKLMHFGYTRKFEVDIDGKPILFEQDEEGQYRALVDYSFLQEAPSINAGLLKEIALVIESVTD